MDRLSDQVPPPSPEWVERNPGWEKVMPDSPRWRNGASIDLASSQPPEQTEAKQGADNSLITEDSVALAFAEVHRDKLRFDHDVGRWLVWDGSIWRQERTKLAYSWAREMARRLAAETKQAKVMLGAGKAVFSAGVERFAQSDRTFATQQDLWNRDPYLLGTPDGTVDLRTGELRPARLEDYITRSVAVSPGKQADCPRWKTFLSQALQDEELVAFLQRWFGYCLTGDTCEHALVFAHGLGGNGKGVLMNTVSDVFGDYAATAAMTTLMTTSADHHTTDIAMLAGARLVLTTEIEERQTWAAAKLKLLTGGDPVTCRFMRKDNFTYKPSFKLMVSGNHKPSLTSSDDAMRRRMLLVPFKFRPEKPDRHLPKDLVKERPGILRWMIEGCLAWQQSGLAPPPAVKEATQSYFDSQDWFGQWLAECCILDPYLETKPGVLFASFQTWCRENGENLRDNRILRELLERTPGLKYVKQMVRGIGLSRTATDRWLNA